MFENRFKDGFYPALGTPTNADGSLKGESFNRQIELMIQSGSQGALCMGSMGKMTTIRNHEFPKIAKHCCDTINKRIPVFIGVMDCSIDRIKDRIDSLGNLMIDGVVTTVPFYSPLKDEETVNFFIHLAKISKYPIYIYDLPGVTQSAITLSQLKSLIKIPNIRGVKSGNISLIKDFYREELAAYNNDFSIFYSNLDLFDVALKSGINKNLDGMFTCTPFNSKEMYDGKGNDLTLSEALKNILKLRNLFIKENVLAAYSYAMELLGCPGCYHADYSLPISNELKEDIRSLMKEMKEI